MVEQIANITQIWFKTSFILFICSKHTSQHLKPYQLLFVIKIAIYNKGILRIYQIKWEREKSPKEDCVLLEIKYFKARHLCLCNNHTNKMSRIHFVVLIPSYITYPTVLKLSMNTWAFCISLSNNITTSKTYRVKTITLAVSHWLMTFSC